MAGEDSERVAALAAQARFAAHTHQESPPWRPLLFPTVAGTQGSEAFPRSSRQLGRNGPTSHPAASGEVAGSALGACEVRSHEVLVVGQFECEGKQGLSRYSGGHFVQGGAKNPYCHRARLWYTSGAAGKAWGSVL
jgi:hypothetical protein